MHSYRYAILATIISVCLLTGCNSIDYSNAQKAYSNGEYAEAAEGFSKLEGYKDADDMVLTCKYAEANMAMEAEDYVTASDLYKYLENYEDAPDKYEECQYRLGSIAYDNKEWEKSIAYLAELEYEPESGYTPAELLTLAQAQLAFSSSDYATTVQLLDDFAGKENEPIYGESAYIIFLDKLAEAAKYYDSDTAIDAVFDYNERTEECQTILDDLLIQFGTLIDSSEYEAFPYMDSIIDGIEEYFDVNELQKKMETSYQQRVTSFLVGEWKRDDNTFLGGAVLEVIESDGTMLGIIRNLDGLKDPKKVKFTIGDIKWKEFNIFSEHEISFKDMTCTVDPYTYELLSSHYDDALATINYEDMTISVHITNTQTANNNGNEQVWRRQ